MRLLPLLFVAGCAELAPIDMCDPVEGLTLDPAFVRLGNDDMAIASLRWYGCADYRFRLCGVGPGWFTEDAIHLTIWHDGTAGECGIDEQIDDQLFNLRSLRHRYEDEFDVESARVPLYIGSHELVYRFDADE